MKCFKFSVASELTELIDFESKGQKFGEKIVTILNLTQLEANDTEFVLFGIPTLSLTSTSIKVDNSEVFKAILKPLLNTQNNQFNQGNKLLVLGFIDAEMILNELSEHFSNSEKIKSYKKTLEQTVTHLIKEIKSAGKIPIVVGGHHENTLNIVENISIINQKNSNLLDLSTHINLEFEQNASELNNWLDSIKLNKYHVFGLHKNQVSQTELDLMNSTKKIDFQLFEDCLHLTTLDKCVKFKNAIDFLNRRFGFILNLQSVREMSSICEASSGFSVRDVRTFIKMVRKENVEFFHLCGFEFSKNESIGNTLSYIISDFIRSDD